MSAKPLVSICCITYNHEPFIRKCLEGFMMQKTTFPFEVLIHDDASTDHTQDIIREFQAQYPDIIKPILQTENQYSQQKPVCRHLWSRAQGKYVAMCEGDDYWLIPDKLQKQVDFLETHPDCSLCFTQGIWHQVDVNTDLADKLYVNFNGQDSITYNSIDLTEFATFPTASIVLKTEILKHYMKVMPLKLKIWAGDQFIRLFAAQAGKVVGLNITAVQYNRHQSGATFHCSEEKNYNQNLLLIKQFPETAQFFKKKFGNAQISTYVLPALKNKEWRKAGIYLLHGIRIAPVTTVRNLFKYLVLKLNKQHN